MPASRDIIGRAWVAVGVRPDAGIDGQMAQVEQRVRSRAHRVNAAARSGMGGGLERGHAGAGGAFGFGHQLAFLLEDVSVVYGQTGKISHAIRAGANNLTMMAIMLGGQKALWLAIAGILATQIGPMLAKAGLDVRSMGDQIERINSLLKIREMHRAGRFAREQIARDVANLFDGGAGATRLQNIDRQLAELRATDQPNITDRLAELENMRANLAEMQRQERLGPTHLSFPGLGRRPIQEDLRADFMMKFGPLVRAYTAIGRYFTGQDSPEDRLKELQKEIAAAKKEELRVTQQLANLEAERARLIQRVPYLNAFQALTGENPDAAATHTPTGMRSALEQLIDPLIAQERGIDRDQQQHQQRLEQALEQGLIPAWLESTVSWLPGQIGDLRRRHLRLRDAGGAGDGLPRGLQAVDINTWREAWRMRAQQNDPQLQALNEMKQHAAELLKAVQRIEDELTAP